MSSLIAHRLSDEHLGRRLASGEAPAFDELYRRYVHRLAAYGTHLLGDGSAGDDIAQVALMRAYQALRAGTLPERVRPWLYRIAHNAAIDVVRNRQELPTGDLPERAGEIRDGSAGAIVEAVAALPDRQRRVFVLRELHGLRIGETAAELGLTTQQVEQSLFAARNRLAEQLVFGERLGCASVRRLADGPLDLRERRALKTHVRSCPACRSELGVRGVALSVLPLPSLEWLRGALTAGSTPVAAKVAAVVATATVAVGVPIAATTHKPHVRVHPRPLTGAPGPDVPLALAATRSGPAARRPQPRVQRVAMKIAAPTQPAQVFALPVTPVAAPTTQPVGAGSITPAQPQPAPTAAAQPASSDGPQAAPAPGPGDGGGTTTTTEDPPATTTTDSGGDTSGGGDVPTSDGSSDQTVTTAEIADPVSDSSGSVDGTSGGTDSSGGTDGSGGTDSSAGTGSSSG